MRNHPTIFILFDRFFLNIETIIFKNEVTFYCSPTRRGGASGFPAPVTIYGASGGPLLGYIHPAKSGHESSVCSRE